ncbi:hypothetical protein AB0M32_38050 [Streptomyces sp. NPDC051985]
MTFANVVDYAVESLPTRGTGVTIPMAIRTILVDNSVSEGQR